MERRLKEEQVRQFEAHLFFEERSDAGLYQDKHTPRCQVHFYLLKELQKNIFVI